MTRQAAHPMLAVPDHDEAARDDYSSTFRHYVLSTLTPGNRVVHDAEVVPAFTRAKGRAPATRQELRQAMERHPYHQMWGSLLRVSQEIMWDGLEGSVHRQLPKLIARAQVKRPVGSLYLDGSFVLPRYLAAVDHHCMPGSYSAEVAEGDVRAGAIYDRGVYIYHHGARGSLHDANGRMLAAFLNGTYPGFAPRRILDMGCSVGHSTVGLAKHFPKAEVHAIDVGAAMLRYAHGRAEALGVPVHFAQANAERTHYADASFDLVVSSNLFHETARPALANILCETKRLLRPGGIMVHMEVPYRYKDLPLLEQVLRGWQTFYNAEPFWDAICSIDVADAAKRAGLVDVRSGYVRRSPDPVKEPRTFTDQWGTGPDFRFIVTARSSA